MEREAHLFNSIPGSKVECTACARRCKIPLNSGGFCFVRQNRGGKLYLVNYGVLEALQIDPIEKKPFNHFHPGSKVLGVGTSSCNWGCQFCQNHNISKTREIRGREFTPEEVVDLALANGVDGIAYTYNEPAIFIEYALDVAKIAKEKGLFNVFVTNGYMTEEAAKNMKGLIDAAVINFKGNGEQKFSNKFEGIVSSEPIKETLVRLNRIGVHVEITDLIIPRVGDSLEACDELTKWISRNLGNSTPVHFNRFHPDYKMLDYPLTSINVLKKHYDIAKRNGLNYVYIGNVQGNDLEGTHCHNCGDVVIKRIGYYIDGWNLDKNNKCKKCGAKIPVIGKPKGKLEIPEIISLY